METLDSEPGYCAVTQEGAMLELSREGVGEPGRPGEGGGGPLAGLSGPEWYMTLIPALRGRGRKISVSSQASLVYRARPYHKQTKTL